jgi:4-amino-4-deoxy-L-arabinose transferase-like glycosyltransferase
MISFGLLLRATFFLATNNGGDALARAETAAGWLQHPSLALDFAGPNWPPVHFRMMAGVSLLVHSVTLGSRLFSLMFGPLSVWIVWRLARDLYGELAALLSVAIFSLYSLHIGYTTTSSSEATYLGLLLAALLCLLAFRRTGAREYTGPEPGR